MQPPYVMSLKPVLTTAMRYMTVSTTAIKVNMTVSNDVYKIYCYEVYDYVHYCCKRYMTVSVDVYKTRMPT